MALWCTTPEKKKLLADLNFLLNFFLQIEEAEIVPPTLNHK